MKVLLFGAMGMLGKTVLKELLIQGEEVYTPLHQDCSVSDIVKVLEICKWFKPDVIINCSGLIPAKAKGESIEVWQNMISVNSSGPHILASVCRQLDIRLVHVSTDCVFDGKLPYPASYTVQSKPTASRKEPYGITKAEGENIFVPLASARYDPSISVVRTSFIGFDHGLLNWVIEQSKGTKPVVGWTRAYWSGSSVFEVARNLVMIAESEVRGIVHLAGPIVTKYELLWLLSHAMGLALNLKRESMPYINRSLEPTWLLKGLEDPETMEELIRNRP